MWSGSSNHFADNVCFGGHEEFAYMSRIFILRLLAKNKQIGSGREGMLLWHTV